MKSLSTTINIGKILHSIVAIILYLSNYSIFISHNFRGNSKNVLWKIVERHLKPFRNHGGRNDHGKGVYLQERPDVEKALKTGKYNMSYS